MIIAPTLERLLEFIAKGIDSGKGNRYTVKRVNGRWIGKKA